MAWPTTKDLSTYAYNQFKGNFVGFVVGTLAARLVSTFFVTRKVSNLWGLTAKKTVVSGSTFRFLEWSCALVVGFIAFVVVNSLVKENLNLVLNPGSRVDEQAGSISSASFQNNQADRSFERKSRRLREKRYGFDTLKKP